MTSDPQIYNLNIQFSANTKQSSKKFAVILVTVQIDLTGKLMTISGGGVSDIYRAKQFHFHWGSEDKRGSEHDINDNHFPMEVRLVHDPANSFKTNISSSVKCDLHVILKISHYVKRLKEHS